MQIFVKINEITRIFDVEPTNLIGNLLLKIEDKLGIPKDRLRSYYVNRILDENTSFKDNYIKKEFVLTLKVFPP